MSKIVIGTVGEKHIGFDTDLLLAGRGLFTADSGGGKSWLVRVLLEQTFGKVQTITIDPEGEFASLREQYAFVLAGKGGETPVDVRSAGMLAHRLLKLRASAICDLYELRSDVRHAWVKAFLDALIEAPKELRAPIILVVDEAHMFCPEKGQGESDAKQSVIDICTRGRKRGLCPILVTQRLAMLDKNATSQLQNRLIGPTFEEVNIATAIKLLGISESKEKTEFHRQIQLLDPGNFFALGRAISRERILIHVRGIETSHPKAFEKHVAAPPPTPEKIKALLPQLADLPKEAETKAKTEADLRTEIRSLKAQLTARPVEQKVTVEEKIVEVPVLKDEQIVNLREAIGALNQIGATLSAAISAATTRKPVTPIRPSIPRPARTHPAAPRRQNPAPTNGSSDLSAAQIKVLSRLVELIECTGVESVRKEQLAAWAEYSPNSGGYNNYLGSLRSVGMIEYPSGGYVTITDAGREFAQPGNPPTDSGEMLERAKRVLGGSEAKLLELLHDSRETVVGSPGTELEFAL